MTKETKLVALGVVAFLAFIAFILAMFYTIGLSRTNTSMIYACRAVAQSVAEFQECIK